MRGELIIRCILFAWALSLPISLGAESQWKQVLEATVGGHLASAAYSGTAPNHQCFGDLDGDGDKDMLVADGSGGQGLILIPNVGTVSSAVWGKPIMGYAGFVPDSHYPECTCALADIDGDGDMDIFVMSRIAEGNWGMIFIENTGTPTVPSWAPQVNFWQSISFLAAMVPAFGDIDDDGDLDLFIGIDYGVGQHSMILYYENQGTKTTPSFPSYSVIYDWGYQQPAAPTIGDIDGDGDLDLIAGIGYAADGKHLVLFENTGTRTNPVWAPPQTGYGFPVINFGDRPSLVDLDADGDLDVFAGAPGLDADHASAIVYYENKGTPQSPIWTVSRPVGLAIGFGYGCNGKAALVDIDGDGDLDLFLAATTVAFYENVGSPFNPRWANPIANYGGLTDQSVFHSIAFCDIDGDGDQDMFLVRGQSDSASPIEFIENIGDPKQAAWGTPVQNYGSISIPNIYASLTFADINGDGDWDLFAGEGNYLGNYGAGGGTIDFFENQGTATHAVWGAMQSNYAAVNVGSFATPAFGDVDGDGDLDLLVGRGGRGAPHGVTFVENVGTSSNPAWGPQQDAYAGIWLPLDSQPVIADLTGDGAPDVLFAAMGLEFYANARPTLSLAPFSKTMLPTTSIDYSVIGGTGVVAFRFVSNASGGALTADGHYVAGLITGVVDAIEARDSTGKIGRAYVNVISPSQVSTYGKAVVMAGRKADDPLWSSTNNLAHYVFRTLLYRGFSKENVLYLNPQTGQDVDGNGNFTDDIDGASSLAAAQQALTSFAQGSPNLFVYMIDHGEADVSGANGQFRLNETELLSASQLDGWLDALQSSGGVTTLTLMVDCCQAGSFLKACAGAPAGKARVVVASATATQPAFFSAGGLISFTNSFVGALCSGLTVGQAFDLAAGGMDRYQQPALDDDGDGVYDKDRDGALARRLGVGASFIAGADRPQIGRISANQSLMGGDAHATIWASDVSAVYPVDRVWATIAAPGFISDAQIEPGQPVTGLPELELTWNAAAEGGGRYEATTNTFTQMGAYAVNIYARDIWGGVAYPKQTYVNQTESDERMVIACGNGAYDSNSPWSYSDYLAASVYETARARWLAHDKIAYLTSAANTAERPVDGAAMKANLQSASAAAAGVSKLTVYLVGRGNGAAFDIDGDGTTSDPDDVTPADLDSWLDAAQSIPTSPTLAVVVLDFTQSGAWVAPLQAPAGKKRIVITSCSGSEASWCEGGGVLSFTQWFFAKVFNGINLRDAFNWSRLAIRAVTGETQNPTLDDDGSGVSDRNDGSLAKGTYIGAAFVTGADSPVIGDYAKDIVLASNSATLWASGVWSPDGIAGAYAYVIKPGATPANDQVDRVDLAYNSANGRWEATYSDFNPALYHRIVYFAEGRGGELSPPYNTLAGPSPEEDLYDRLYNDNTTATLNFISAGNWSQKHNLWMPGDEDWVVFNADANRSYSILVTNQSSACDAAIYLYHESNLTSTVLPGGGPRDDYGPGDADEMIEWPSGSTSGTMLVKITQSSFSPGLSGEGTSYTLEIFGSWGPNAGLATISGTQIMAGAAACCLMAGPGGIYTKPQQDIPAGCLASETEFVLDDPGDIGNQPYFASTSSWLAAHPGNASIVQIQARQSVSFQTPVDVTLQFVNDGPTDPELNFTVDDLPPGADASKMKIHQWTGSSWEVVPGAQTVAGDTVTVSMDAFLWDSRQTEKGSVAVAAFAVAPVETPVLATLIVSVTPNTAPWSFLDSQGGSHSGTGNATVTDLPAGTATFTWGALANHDAPTPNPVTVDLVGGESREVSGAYTRHTGSVTVEVTPAGAPWSFTDGDGASHGGTGGTTLSGIPTGTIMMTWLALADYTSPSPNPVSQSLAKDGTVTFSGTYTPTSLPTGTVGVEVTPHTAPWTFVDSNAGIHMGAGDASVSSVPAGEVEMTWRALANFDEPSPNPMSHTLLADDVTTFTGIYVRHTGTVVVDVTPDAAPWSFADGDAAPHAGTGDGTVPNVPTGSIVMTWNPLSGYTQSSATTEQKPLSKGGTITFVKVYTALPPARTRDWVLYE